MRAIYNTSDVVGFIRDYGGVGFGCALGSDSTAAKTQKGEEQLNSPESLTGLALSSNYNDVVWDLVRPTNRAITATAVEVVTSRVLSINRNQRLLYELVDLQAQERLR